MLARFFVLSTHEFDQFIVRQQALPERLPWSSDAQGRKGRPPSRPAPIFQNRLFLLRGGVLGPSGRWPVAYGTICQTPERVGLPSAVLGVGASSFTFPSGVLGVPAEGYRSHWAESDGEKAAMIANATAV